MQCIMVMQCMMVRLWLLQCDCGHELLKHRGWKAPAQNTPLHSNHVPPAAGTAPRARVECSNATHVCVLHVEAAHMRVAAARAQQLGLKVADHAADILRMQKKCGLCLSLRCEGG